MASNVHEYSVSEIAFALKRTIEDAYGLVRVRGEISGLKRAASGHVYLTLKDEKAVLDGVCWRGTASRLPFKPEDGLEVICTGKLTTYPGRSRYQLVIERMEPAGAGALMALLEERKKRLAAEGLFDQSRKKDLPYLPEIIGIVTSPTGAVIRDILHRIEDRFPRHVIVWPVMVQGEGSAVQIAQAIDGFQALEPKPDLLIVARGGGSIEDLWSFNEEIVARAAADSKIPLISAVGHETDTTLIDFVSDRRAPTPTAAAELAVPVRHDLLVEVKGLDERLNHAAIRFFDRLRDRFLALARGLPEPRMMLGLSTQKLDDLGERLNLRSPLLMLEERHERVVLRHNRIEEILADRLRQASMNLQNIGPKRLSEAIERTLETAQKTVLGLSKLLENLDYHRVLERGFALVHRVGDDGLISSRIDAEREAALEIEFHDGRTRVVRGSEARKPPRKKTSIDDQGTLL